MNRRNIITIIVAMILCVTTASADIIKGVVVDSETKEPLLEASVECMFSVGEHGFAVTTATTDSVGVFNIAAFGRSNIKVSMFGYYEKSKPVLALSGSQKDTLDYNWLKASVFTEIRAEQLRYTASPEQNTTIWDNRYGLSAEVTVGSFVFNTVIAEGTHRGYTISSMNRNILSWDASVTWKILKNKGLLTLEFDDILNNEDGRYSQQTAYQKFTTWQDFRHHYIGLSFTYHLDAKKKE